MAYARELVEKGSWALLTASMRGYGLFWRVVARWRGSCKWRATNQTSQGHSRKTTFSRINSKTEDGSVDPGASLELGWRTLSRVPPVNTSGRRSSRMVLAGAQHEQEIAKKIEEAFNGMHTCMKFTYVTISMHITGNKPEKSKPLKVLAINLIPTFYANHDFIIETKVNIKESSPYSFTPYSSAQPKAVVLARITTTRH